jgi:hypothetical protein
MSRDDVDTRPSGHNPVGLMVEDPDHGIVERSTKVEDAT